MNTIKILDKETVNKISAGEVIERPASVVKELIENSIDAGADMITVEIKEAGSSLIKVSDNGKGMSKEDARLSIIKHATSKLEDLFNIKTLGFRGEALASISSVSDMLISTSKGDIGTSLKIESGEIKEEKKVGISKGTIIEVKDLFYNTPARKKYLKSKETELSRITDIVTRYSLSNNNISFRMIKEGKEVISAPKDQGLIGRIVSLHGKDIGKNMLPVSYSDNLFRINGFTGKPYIALRDKSMQSVFINSRFVRCKEVSDAAYDAYHTLLFLNKNPVFVINIEIDFSLVDVNVHPSKEIIRIEKGKELYEAVFSALRKTFTENSLIPDIEIEEDSSGKGKEIKRYTFSKDKQTQLDSAKEDSEEYTKDLQDKKETTKDLSKEEIIKAEKENISKEEDLTEKKEELAKIQEKDITRDKENILSSGKTLEELYSEETKRQVFERVSSAKKSSKENIQENTEEKYKEKTKQETKNNLIGPAVILGQLNKTYILAENPKGLLIIDQHAAEERIMFEELSTQISKGKVIKQSLLKPFIIELGIKESISLKENINILKEIGFDTEEYGKDSFIIRTIPKLFSSLDKNSLISLLTDLKNIKSIGSEEKEEFIAKKACRKAVKAGKDMTEKQSYSLIEELSKCKNPYACPHGRPTIINISISELEKKFKRKA